MVQIISTKVLFYWAWFSSKTKQKFVQIRYIEIRIRIIFLLFIVKVLLFRYSLYVFGTRWFFSNFFHHSGSIISITIIIIIFIIVAFAIIIIINIVIKFYSFFCLLLFSVIFLHIK